MVPYNAGIQNGASIQYLSRYFGSSLTHSRRESIRFSHSTSWFQLSVIRDANGRQAVIASVPFSGMGPKSGDGK
jgi:hypothetical protein